MNDMDHSGVWKHVRLLRNNVTGNILGQSTSLGFVGKVHDKPGLHARNLVLLVRWARCDPECACNPLDAG